MCGFVALVGAQSPPQQQLWPMLDSIRSRGPDDICDARGDWFTLGLCRLSIMVLGDEGRQPVTSDASDVHLVFNGEIYNIGEIKQRIRKEYGLVPTSEAEALLLLYQRLGASFVEQLDGDYAIVVLDSRSRTCLAFRDPFGVKPLYYAALDNGRTWALCSHVKPFFRHPGFSTQLDSVALMERRVLNFWGSHRTCFDAIHQLVPGRYLSIRVPGEHARPTLEHENVPAFTLRGAPLDAGHDVDAGQICVRCEDAIGRAIRKRVEHSEVSPIVLALSGGIDSSLIAMLARDAREHLKAVTVFDSEECRDQEYASQLSTHLGVPHHLYRIDYSEFLAEFPRIVLEMAGPSPSYTPYFLGRAMKHFYPSAKVLLCGEGADEFFIGYQLLLDSGEFRRASVETLRGFSSDLATESLLLQRVRQWESSDEESWLSLVDMFQREQLVNLHLVPFDHGTMAHGVECRVPFLDADVVQLIQTVPAHLRALGKTTKIFLRILLAQSLGRSSPLANTLLGRPSSPAFFSTLYCRSTLRQFIRARLHHSTLAQSALGMFTTDEETLFWLASVAVIFLKHRGQIDGMEFADLADEVFAEPAPIRELEAFLRPGLGAHQS